MKNKLQLHYDRFKNTLTFSAADFSPAFREDADFWRLHIDFCQSGKNNELGIYSKSQTPTNIEQTDGALTIYYENLTAEDGVNYPIGLTLTVKESEGGLSFGAVIHNRSTLRVNELQYPLLEVERLETPLEEDILYLPLGLGDRICNPYEMTRKAHTEYMAADYKNTWKIYSYPGKMSMPWFGVQSGRHFLYLARLDKTFRITNFVTGAGARQEAGERFLLSISSYPAVLPSETLTLEGYRVEVFDTDWREAADSYRAWANATFLAPLLDESGRITKKESIKQLNGWQRIILKHQYGEIFHTYRDLPRIYAEGARYGIHMILLFAWWKEGMDNGYPNYEPDEDLGGADALREAIREINSMGGQVVLYSNGHLIDVTTDFYRIEGQGCTMKNIEQQEYQEFYKFSNNGTMLQFGGLKTFAGGCSGAAVWREKIMELSRRHLSLGSNGTFFDQFSYCFRLCFDKGHDHGNRIDIEPQFRADLVARIRETLSEHEWLGSEWVSDRISPLLDFTHGCGTGMRFAENAYPYIYRYTFPEIMVSNRLIHDEKEGYQRELNYAFVYGLLFDVSLYRGRIDSIESCPKYAAHIKKLIDLREPYRAYFTDGRFDLPSMPLPTGVWGAEYELSGKRILTVWNDADSEVVLDTFPPVPAGDVAILEFSI